MLNTTTDKTLIARSREEVEQIYKALEQENSEHLSDFAYLLNSYRAVEIAEIADNPEKIKRNIRAGLHPISNDKLLEKYQKAKKPEHFSSWNISHMDALKLAWEKLKVPKKSDFFSDLMFVWQKTGTLKTMAEKLEEGMCFGVTMRANKLVCKDPKISPGKIYI